MNLLKAAFDLIPEATSTRAFSATDIAVRLPVSVSNPRALTTALRGMGKIVEKYRLGGEKFYIRVPGATPPLDARQDGARIQAAARKRQRQLIMARARLVRRAKRMTPA